MVYFQNKNPNLGKFWRILQWKMSIHFMPICSLLTTIWYILWPCGIFCGHCVYFMVIWNNFPRFGMLYQEKSGNPGFKLC
jgi:hypothetical protein